MECTKWVEEGLLYAAGELSDSPSDNYRKHLTECEFCRTEISEYSELKNRFFTAELLQETPPPHVDHEILRVCSTRPRAQIMIPGFFGAFRKATFAAAFLVVGFVGVGYYAYVLQDTKNKATRTAAALAPAKISTAVGTLPAATALVDQTQGTPRDSSGSDSLRSTRPFSQTQGNLSDERVITVGTANE